MDVVFVLPRTRPSGLVNVMQLLAAELGVRVIHLDEGAGYSLRRFAAVLAELKRLKRSGVRVHSSGFFPDVLNALSGRRLSSTTLHGFLGPEYALLYGPVRGRVLAVLQAAAVRRLEERLACSGSVEEFLRRRYRLETRACVNGCRVSPAALRQLEPALGLGARTYYFAGPYIARKNVVAAARAVLEGDPEASFRAFGKGPQEAELRALDPAGQRLTLGPVPDPTEHYRSGQFYMTFSHFEGMPLGAIEAVRCGCIPVLSAIPPHQELLRLLDLPALRCFEAPADAVAWARSLDLSARAELARALARRGNALFSEAAFADRFRSLLVPAPERAA